MYTVQTFTEDPFLFFFGTVATSDNPDPVSILLCLLPCVVTAHVRCCCPRESRSRAGHSIPARGRIRCLRVDKHTINMTLWSHQAWFHTGSHTKQSVPRLRVQIHELNTNPMLGKGSIVLFEAHFGLNGFKAWTLQKAVSKQLFYQGHVSLDVCWTTTQMPSAFRWGSETSPHPICDENN